MLYIHRYIVTSINTDCVFTRYPTRKSPCQRGFSSMKIVTRSPTPAGNGPRSAGTAKPGSGDPPKPRIDGDETMTIMPTLD